MSFKVRVQRGRRVQIPRVVRWRFRLEPGEVFFVTVWFGFRSEDFYAAMTRDGRIRIPRVIEQELLKGRGVESLEGCTVQVTLNPTETGEGDS